MRRWLTLVARRKSDELFVLNLLLVTLGPLTNLALALRLDPTLPSRVGRLVVMGGAVTGQGNTSIPAEFNVAFDPEAADVVFRGFPAFELADWEAVVRHGFPHRDFEAWLGAGDGPDGGPQRMAAAAVAYDYAEFRSLADGDARLISAGSREIAAAAGLTSTGVVGEAFSYQIPAGGTPTAYLATGLPTGLALNPTTGMITGVPLAAGVFDAEIGASKM